MRWAAILPLLSLLLGTDEPIGDGAGAFGAEIAVVVNPSRRASLTREELARIYLRKRRFWPDGKPILPVNRNAQARLRHAFDAAVFGEGIGRLPIYWNRAYFQGVLPPATLASDEAVRRFVASEPRAIGYLDAASVDESVQVVLRLPNPHAGERVRPTGDPP